MSFNQVLVLFHILRKMVKFQNSYQFHQFHYSLIKYAENILLCAPKIVVLYVDYIPFLQRHNNVNCPRKIISTKEAQCGLIVFPETTG